MLWFLIHHLVHLLPFGENQTKNLFTFVFGTLLYTILYSYFGAINKETNAFIFMLFNYFAYIVLADGFSMAIIYKNYYKTTIFTEIKETIGSPTIAESTHNLDDNLIDVMGFNKPINKKEELSLNFTNDNSKEVQNLSYNNEEDKEDIEDIEEDNENSHIEDN